MKMNQIVSHKNRLLKRDSLLLELTENDFRVGSEPSGVLLGPGAYALSRKNNDVSLISKKRKQTQPRNASGSMASRGNGNTNDGSLGSHH